LDYPGLVEGVINEIRERGTAGEKCRDNHWRVYLICRALVDVTVANPFILALLPYRSVRRGEVLIRKVIKSASLTTKVCSLYLDYLLQIVLYPSWMLDVTGFAATL
jgi:hypothetical protein